MRFIHASDLHLGIIPDGQKSWGRERGNAVLSSLDKIVDLVLRENADALFLTGQSFHFPPLREDVERIRQAFARIPFCHVLLFSKSSNAYHFLNSATFPRNVHILKEDREELYIDELNLDILALEGSFLCKEELEHFSPRRSDAIPILLCNTKNEDFLLHNSYLLSSLPFSYIALGGKTEKKILLENRMVYPGSPEPLGKDSMGKHGVFVGNIHPIRKIIDALDFLPLSSAQYLSLHFNLDKTIGTEALRSVLDAEIKKRKPETIYRIRFSGYRDPETKISEDLFPKYARIIEWVDESVPYYDFHSLYKEHSDDLLGLFIRSYLKENIEDLSKREQDALFYGVSALLQGGMA